MMDAWLDSLMKYGQAMTLITEDEPDGVAIRGFLKELDFRDAQKLRAPLALGEADTERYLYIGPPSPAPGDPAQAFLHCQGENYAFRRVSPRRIGGKVTHWEGILRHIGEVSDDD